MLQTRNPPCFVILEPNGPFQRVHPRHFDRYAIYVTVIHANLDMAQCDWRHPLKKANVVLPGRDALNLERTLRTYSTR